MKYDFISNVQKFYEILDLFFKMEEREMEKLVVTRYKTLVEYLKKINLITEDTKVIPHATPDDVKNKHVIGVLPYWLSCHAARFTEVQLRIPQEKRGKELTVEEIEFYSLTPRTFEVREVAFESKEEKKQK